MKSQGISNELKPAGYEDYLIHLDIWTKQLRERERKEKNSYIFKRKKYIFFAIGLKFVHTYLHENKLIMMKKLSDKCIMYTNTYIHIYSM